MSSPGSDSFPTPRRILVVQTAFLGDIILALPLVQVARRTWPDARVDFLTIPVAAGLLAGHPDIGERIIYDKRGRDRGFAAFHRLARRLRATRYDLAVVPHRSIRSAALVTAARIPRRVGFDRSAGRRLFHHVVPYRWDVHEIHRNLELLRPFGVDPERRERPFLPLTADDRGVVDGWLSERGIAGDREVIALAPGSVWATKRWLPEGFADLAERLQAEGFAVVLVGGPEDVPLAEAIAERCATAPPIAAGPFSLRQSTALIDRARLLVTNDSAPLHLAVARRTPIVAIFGATVPALGFYPYGRDDMVVERTELACRPCGRHGGNRCPLGHFHCMRRIGADDVFDAVRERLRRAENASEQMETDP